MMNPTHVQCVLRYEDMMAEITKGSKNETLTEYNNPPGSKASAFPNVRGVAPATVSKQRCAVHQKSKVCSVPHHTRPFHSEEAPPLPTLPAGLESLGGLSRARWVEHPRAASSAAFAATAAATAATSAVSSSMSS